MCMQILVVVFAQDLPDGDADVFYQVPVHHHNGMQLTAWRDRSAF